MEKKKTTQTWEMTKKELRAQTLDKSKAESYETERFYFWLFSEAGGWRQLGYTEGYKTEKALREDNKYHFDKKDIIRITKSTIIKRG